MSNMSYCRFENTLEALEDCVGAMELADSVEDLELSAYELTAYRAMWRTARDFLALHERLQIHSNWRATNTAG